MVQMKILSRFSEAASILDNYATTSQEMTWLTKMVEPR